MDINQILPMLMGNMGDDNDKAKLFSTLMSGGKSEDILSSFAKSGDGNPADMLSKMQGGNMDMMALMNMLNAQKKTSNHLEGLNVISSFAPPDILGTMYKMLSTH